MARSGSAAGEPSAAIATRGSSGPASRPAAPGRGNKMALGLVGLGLVSHVLRSRRFQEAVVVTAIALGGMRVISRDNRASMMTRLSSWNKRQVQRIEHKAGLEHEAKR